MFQKHLVIWNKNVTFAALFTSLIFYIILNLVNFTSYSKNMGGEKMEVAGMSIMFIPTTITSSRWADTLRRKYQKEPSIK